MTTTKRILGLLTFSLGAIGLIACVAAMIVVFLNSMRLTRATEKVFAVIDTTLVRVRDGVVATEQKVRAAKITSEDLGQSLKNRTKVEVKDRLIAKIDVEEKSERLLSGLQQGDLWLETAESSVQLVQQIAELAHSVGAPIDTGAPGQLLEEIGALRGQLADSTKLVANIRDRITGDGEPNSLEQKIQQAIQLAFRLAATLGSIDIRLSEFDNKLAGTQQRLVAEKAKTIWWTRVATLGFEILLIWMAAGQIALCRCAWRSRHQDPIKNGL